MQYPANDAFAIAHTVQATIAQLASDVILLILIVAACAALTIAACALADYRRYRNTYRFHSLRYHANRRD